MWANTYKLIVVYTPDVQDYSAIPRIYTPDVKYHFPSFYPPFPIRARTTLGTPTLSRCGDVMILLPNGMCSDWSFGCLLVPSNHKCATKALEFVKLPGANPTTLTSTPQSSNQR
jgi:hypothetical protein